MVARSQLSMVLVLALSLVLGSKLIWILSIMSSSTSCLSFPSSNSFPLFLPLPPPSPLKIWLNGRNVRFLLSAPNPLFRRFRLGRGRGRACDRSRESLDEQPRAPQATTTTQEIEDDARTSASRATVLPSGRRSRSDSLPRPSRGRARGSDHGGDGRPHRKEHPAGGSVAGEGDRVVSLGR